MFCSSSTGEMGQLECQFPEAEGGFSANVQYAALMHLEAKRGAF
jgi:hypothetical protein